MLERGVHEAGSDATGQSWDDRDAVADEVRADLDPRFRSLEGSSVAEGVAYEVQVNGSAANKWTAEHCPSGPDRQFGDCEAIDGVVVQERAGETTVLAVAVDLTVTTQDGVSVVTVVVPFVG